MSTFEINDRYVDVDLSREIDPETGRPYPIGYNGTGTGKNFCDYNAVATILTRKQIEEEAEKTQAEKAGNAQLIVEVKNQRQEGSCVGNASTQGLQVIQARRLGKDKVTLLSAIATYKQIGRSPGSGAMVDDSMEALEQVGTLPLDTPENVAKFGAENCMPATGFYTKFPSNWKETAKKFRLGEVLIVRSFEALLTALLCGHPVVVGREGHSILYLDVIVRNGRLYALYVNSWGKWGQGAGDFSYGFGLDTENQIRKSAGWAYAMRSMVERS